MDDGSYLSYARMVIIGFLSFEDFYSRGYSTYVGGILSLIMDILVGGRMFLLQACYYYGSYGVFFTRGVGGLCDLYVRSLR